MNIDTTQNLIPIAQFGEDIVLYVVKGSDLKKEDLKGVQINFSNKEFAVDLVGRFAKFTAYEDIDIKDKNVVKYFVDKIYRSLPVGVVFELLKTNF